MSRDRVLAYAKKALSQQNAINAGAPDDDTNVKYRLQIEIANCGDAAGGSAGFVFHVTVPRQVNNELARSLHWDAESIDEALAFLDDLRTLLSEADLG